MLEVRRVAPAEWRELRELRLEALRDSPDAFWTLLGEALQRNEADWRAWTALPCHVAVVSGRLVGMVAADSDEDDPTTAQLIAMYVSPGARGVGAGNALVAAQLAWARREGFRRMRLMVNSENDDARRLYRRAGFADTGVQTLLREGPHVLVEMTCEV